MANIVADSAREEELVKALRAAMMEERPIPAGLVVRLQANVSRARASAERFTVGERVVLATLLFTGLAYTGGAAGVITGALVATVYGAGLNKLGTQAASD